MKKLKKMNLKTIESLSIEEQKQIKGGTTEAQMLLMIDAGTWHGGSVDGLGYVGPNVTITGDVWTKGKITSAEAELILTAAIAGGEVGGTFGPYGAATGFVLSGLAATWAAYTH